MVYPIDFKPMRTFVLRHAAESYFSRPPSRRADRAAKTRMRARTRATHQAPRICVA